MAEKDKRSPAQRVPLRPFDSLFEPTLPQKEENRTPEALSIDELHPFKDHPFLPYTEERMAEMVAVLSGVSYASIRRFETTGEISLSSLINIAIALDCTDEFDMLFQNRTPLTIQEIIDGNV